MMPPKELSTTPCPVHAVSPAGDEVQRSPRSDVRERPILFSAPMVRALLAGAKTQTRRVVKGLDVRAGMPHPEWESLLRFCPYGQPGERLWVRESFYAWGHWETRFSAKKGRDEWHFVDMTMDGPGHYLYAADGAQAAADHRSTSVMAWWKRPAIFMPSAASRILLEVTGVRVEQLQDISDADAAAEGTPCYVCGRTMDGLGDDDCHCFHAKAKASDYRALWEQINGLGSWDANPWVWVVEFRRVTP